MRCRLDRLRYLRLTMYSRRRLRVDPEKPALGILGMRAGHQLTGDRKRVPTLWQVHGSEPRSGRSEARGAAAVSADVDLRALDDRRRAACLTDRRAEASPPSMTKRTGRSKSRVRSRRLASRLAGLHTVAFTVVRSRRARTRASALRIHAQREQDHVVAEVQAVDEDKSGCRSPTGTGRATSSAARS